MNSGDGFGLFAIGALLGLALSGIYFSATGTADHVWQRQAIEHGAGEYDSVSGDWKWKEPKATP